METFQRVFQPDFNEIFDADYVLKGKWAKEVFVNDNPIVLELGCGKGEYTTSMAELFTEKNFLGVDIKGARLWRGAKTVNEKNILNAAFLRTRIEFTESFFSQEEIDEIWITFPDPQLKKRRNKKRLTASVFLNKYRSFLKDNGIINLKTDSDKLYHYTRELAVFNHLHILKETDDLYHSEMLDVTLNIQTYYERQFIQTGSSIKYISFQLPREQHIIELADEKA